MFTNKKISILALFLIFVPILKSQNQNEVSPQVAAPEINLPEAPQAAAPENSAKKEQGQNLFTQKIEDFVFKDENLPEEKSTQETKENTSPENTPEQNQAITPTKPEEKTKATEKAKTDKQKSEQKEDEPKDIFLNFENADLATFVKYISELKNMNLVPDPKLQGVKVSLTVRTPLTVEGAWKVFLTILDMGGYSIVQRGEVQVIIPKADKVKQPLPAYINVPLDTLPDSDINIRYVTFLQNISVSEISDLLKGMLSPEGVVIPYAEVNGLIITDKSLNIKAGMKIINELDQTGLQESVEVIKLKNANATDVKTLFESLIQKPEGNPLLRLLGKQAESTLEYFSPSTKIIAEERTNSLILLGNKKSIQKIEDFITKYLDTELKGVTSPLHIYELQNTDATAMKTILEVVAAPSEEKSKYGAVRGGVKYFKKMNFQVDKDGNRLLVSSSDKQDWKLLKQTIEDLDKPQPQVAVETLIVSVNLEDNKQFGGTIRNKFQGEIGKGVNFQAPTYNGTIVKSDPPDPNSLLGNMLNGITGGIGSTILSFGKSTNIWAAFKALKSQVNTSVLSQPFFTAVNNQKAHIQIGNTINVVNETTEGGFQGFAERTAFLTVDVTPQINLDGIIRLTIDTTLEEFTDLSLGNKSTRKVTTDVSVADGQILVLGGFIRTQVNESENKTPLLGDVPILGWMFKNKTKTITKSYIFIFMSPTVIKPRTTPGANLYTRMKLHDATGYIDEAVETKRTKDPIHNWFFNPDGENYSHKVVDFANARYQPTTVDIKNDPYYRATPKSGLKDKIKDEDFEENLDEKVTIQKAENLGLEDKEDKSLDEKRKKLKELISNTPAVVQEEPPKAVTTPEKIEKQEQLKELISNKPQAKNEIKENPSGQKNKLIKLKSRRLG